ncbi:hypothetical protein TSOC_003963 [Tetrabaena socialis]|uniref:Uncharacterized protein n=1 Tax=Tetrabaena socialis TaxID=47790 RepID=A0A2J8AA34_9CHLO|nr:hypothetical protein TSOC_003963 [Tetrabaena socialis]|eukprot:PNH09380.1 hypothetical protein TSOC_003963 [Tetrabaena socialis]
MADCLKGGDGKGQFTNMDGTEGTVGMAAAPAPAGRRAGGTLGACTLAYIAFVSFIAIIAFILGCYSTNRVRTLSYPDALLVSDPSKPPGPGYSVFSLGTGLGYWAPETDMLFARSDHGPPGAAPRADGVLPVAHAHDRDI